MHELIEEETTTLLVVDDADAAEDDADAAAGQGADQHQPARGDEPDLHMPQVEKARAEDRLQDR